MQNAVHELTQLERRIDFLMSRAQTFDAGSKDSIIQEITRYFTEIEHPEMIVIVHLI